MELINTIFIAVGAPAFLIFVSVILCNDILGLREAAREVRRERRR